MDAAREIIVITGATGFIGVPLIERLARDYCLVALDRPGPPHPPASAEAIEFDITSDASVAAALKTLRARHGNRIASVIHLAGYYDFSGEPSPLYDAVNVRGTARLLEALQDFEVEQFVYASTMLVHAPCDPGFYIREDSPLGPAWVYSQSKLAAEDVVRTRRGRIPAVIARLAGVYDDWTHAPTLAQQIQRIYERQVVSHVFPGHISHGQSALYLDDLVDFFSLAVARRARLPEDFTVLVGEPEPLNYDELQHVLGRLIHGDDWETLRIPKAVAQAGAWLQDALPGQDPFIKPWMIPRAEDHYALDISRARDVLGWQPRHRLRDVLPRMLARLKGDPLRWYRENKLEPPEEVRTQASGHEHAEMMQQQHLGTIWVHCVNMTLGVWLIFSPATLSYDEPAMIWSDLASGALVLLFGALALSWRYRWGQWANTVVGMWLLFAPLVFWTASPAAYLNDSIIGALVITFAILVPPMPGMSAEGMMSGPDVPPGWNYTPSSWSQRIPIIGFALIGFFLARYLAAYQLGHIDAVWDPFFGAGTATIITSDVSRAWPVPDAGLGALSYMLEALSGAMGAKHRWRTMPWMVAMFGVLVIPLGAVSIFFIIIQPIWIGTWCTICLITAVAMVIMLPYSFDEVVAMIQFLVRNHRNGKPFWRAFWMGGTLSGDTKDPDPGFGAPLRVIVREMAMGGVNFPWTLLLSVAIGVWLMFTRLIFGTEGAMANSDHLVGALAIVVAVSALAEVARSLRFINVLFGAWLLIAPWVLQGGTAAAAVGSVLAGFALIALSLPRGLITQPYGGWERYIY